MHDSVAAFRAGDRPDDVVIYIADTAVDDPDQLAAYGDRVDDGTLLVLEGEHGRRVFQTATGQAAMNFAQEAMQQEGAIAPTLTSGDCPDCDDGHLQVLLAFFEPQNEAVGGRYAEGDVIHAYARCSCGAAYSTRWID